MRANDDAAFLAFKVRVTGPNGVVAEGECFAMSGGIDPNRMRHTIIDLIRTSADQWEFASAEAS